LNGVGIPAVDTGMVYTVWAIAAARVVVRRVPGGARVGWLVIPDRGLDPGNPVVRAELESALTELRAATGLEDPKRL